MKRKFEIKNRYNTVAAVDNIFVLKAIMVIDSKQIRINLIKQIQNINLAENENNSILKHELFGTLAKGTYEKNNSDKNNYAWGA